MRLSRTVKAVLLCSAFAAALPFMPTSKSEAFLAFPAANFGCPASAPLPACLAQFDTQTWKLDGATGDFTTAKIDQSLTYASGFKAYYDQCFGQTPSVGAGGTTLNTTSADVGEASGGYQATLASGTCKGTSFIGTGFGGGGYFEVTASWTAIDCHATTCGGKWQAPLWLNYLEGSLSPIQSPWSGQASNYIHGAEFDVNEMFQGNFSDPLSQWQISFHDWYDLSTSKNAYSGDGFVASPGQSSFSSLHSYGLLWKVATASSPGFACSYYDGQPTPVTGTTTGTSCLTWAQFINNGGQVPPPGAGVPWNYGIADGYSTSTVAGQQHFILYIGCAQVTPCHVTKVQVWQATSANNLVI